ncbi:MAG: hypothetical protein Q9160_001704 [Pyrenula sp. 1 TL-2023]
MTNHQDQNRHSGALQGLLRMFRFDNPASLVAPPEEEMNGDVDEPPDGIPTLERSHTLNHLGEYQYAKAVMPRFDRKESLLTRALVHSPDLIAQTSPTSLVSRGQASFSTQSTASTAELTSDGGMTSPARTASPSPPLPPARLPTLNGLEKPEKPSKILIAPSSNDQLPPTADVQESRVEANLGRKRCVMFACGRKSPPPPAPKLEEAPQDPPKRKSRLTFACPMKAAKEAQSLSSEVLKPKDENADPNKLPTSPPISRTSTISSLALSHSKDLPKTSGVESGNTSPSHTFHEFGSSHDDDDWVREPTEHMQKLTLTDCMKKEMAIRKIGEEAEEEAEEDDAENDGVDDDDGDNEDDFAPSDGSTTDGNESDDEGGFAESDDESDDGSEYQFWAPSTTTAATSVEHLEEVRPHAFRRKSNSSIESTAEESGFHRQISPSKLHKRHRPIKAPKIRPSTPDLPDSTDFVCGTLDEDRPLEAAYKSCMEQKKRAKQVVLPQDIDPSFPTTDPEDADDNEEQSDSDVDDIGEVAWMGGHMEDVEDGTDRGRLKSTAALKRSPAHSPKRMRSPPPPRRFHSPPPGKRILSPAPTKRLRSPPRKLFSQSPQHYRSPPAPLKLHSPPATRRASPEGTPAGHVPIGITINRLAQRPSMTRTASLPHTPNPYFFRNHQPNGHQSIGVVGESEDEGSGREMHIRGAVDIVIGLEKKRQKRKEKFWRQHCRKAAKEHAERKTLRGKGAERMKELGLECAERTRGYGVGQQAQHVLSL